MHDYWLLIQAQARRQAIAQEVTAIRRAQTADDGHIMGRVKHALRSLAVTSVRVAREGDTHDSTGRTILAVD